MNEQLLAEMDVVNWQINMYEAIEQNLISKDILADL